MFEVNVKKRDRGGGGARLRDTVWWTTVYGHIGDGHVLCGTQPLVHDGGSMIATAPVHSVLLCVFNYGQTVPESFTH